MKIISKKNAIISTLIMLLTYLFSQSYNLEGFISTQSPVNEFIKWQEFSSPNISHSYISPVKESQVIKSNYKEFYLKYRNISDFYFRVIPKYFNNSGNKSFRFQLNGSMRIPISSRLSIQNDFAIDNKGAENPHYMGFPRPTIGEWTGYIQQSILCWQFTNSHFLIGRGNFQFGAINSGLLLNSNHPPAEIIWWHINKNSITFDWGTEFLDSVNHNNRFLTFHRIGYESKLWRIGFTEASMVAYNSLGTSELRFLMPSSLLLETEENRVKNTNLMWLLDYMLKLKGLTIFGEILIDDYALDNLSPHKLAGKIGVGSKFGKLHLFVEYVRINRWVGNYSTSEFRFTEHNVLIGHPLGPDSHSAEIGIFIPIDEKISLMFDMIWQEEGSGSIDEQWPVEDAQHNFGYANEPFPSGNINSLFSGNLQIDYFLSNRIKSTLQINLTTKDTPKYGFSCSVNI
ncbi:MAG: hypothetical protein H8E71_06285 [Candidatus Marinimicrobia bacterium]|nr:hypothetical protein [Candidatus Neomarinimicrobiota bacterium]MBL7109962.1 hypothetical protein [Candidatus Neomarinimicrobiota bacterium]